MGRGRRRNGLKTFWDFVYLFAAICLQKKLFTIPDSAIKSLLYQSNFFLLSVFNMTTFQKQNSFFSVFFDLYHENKAFQSLFLVSQTFFTIRYYEGNIFGF